MTTDYRVKEAKIKELIATATSPRDKVFYEGLLKKAIQRERGLRRASPHSLLAQEASESRPSGKTEAAEEQDQKKRKEKKSNWENCGNFPQINFNFPEISEYLSSRLSNAYSRYEHFSGIVSGDFDQAEIEQDQQKYAHLLLPEEDGLPVFGARECIEYMHLSSGLPKIYCLVMMYRQESFSPDLIQQLVAEIEGETQAIKVAKNTTSS